jgi:hypothetical protein
MYWSGQLYSVLSFFVSRNNHMIVHLPCTYLSHCLHKISLNKPLITSDEHHQRMIYASLSVQPLHNFVGNYIACISQFFVMNRAKQCKCQAIFSDPFYELIVDYQNMQASVSPHPITFFVLAFLITRYMLIVLMFLSFCCSSWKAILPQLLDCS